MCVSSMPCGRRNGQTRGSRVRTPSSFGGVLAPALGLLLALGHGEVRAAMPPTITIAEGTNAVISGGEAHQTTPGLRLNACDIVRTGPQSLVQIEYEDGSKIELGPDTRLVFDLPGAGGAVVGPHFLLSGWAKLTAAKRDVKALPYRIDTPHFDLLLPVGVTTLRAAAEGGAFFVEQGSAFAITGGGARVAVGSGRTYSRKAGGERGTVVERADPAFVQAMPAAFRDTLPSLLGQLKSRAVQPRPATGVNVAEAEAWIKAEPALSVCLSDPTVRSAQEALDRQGFELGRVDGILGPRTQAALRGYQRKNGLAPTGQLDSATLRSLDIPERR
jgi:hypothetical protein